MEILSFYCYFKVIWKCGAPSWRPVVLAPPPEAIARSRRKPAGESRPARRTRDPSRPPPAPPVGQATREPGLIKARARKEKPASAALACRGSVSRVGWRAVGKTLNQGAPKLKN
jgi:hypothetical protein